MRSLFRHAAPLIAAFLFALPLWARPAPPQTAPEITIVDYGIYCQPGIVGQEEAPDTDLGYVNLFSENPVIRFHQQEVPAELGVSFGVIVRSDTDFPSARMQSWKPGQTKPDIWYAELVAGDETSRGFTFEFEEELVIGTWRQEAWDGDRLLYRIEFEVMPPATLPGELSDCNLLS
jgi:Domain of unknown function (DUF3859)